MPYTTLELIAGRLKNLFAIMSNLFVHPWAGVRSDQTWTRWGRRKPWILVGVPLAVSGLLAIPLARTLASVMVAILVTNLGRALFVPPMVAWLGDLFPAAQRSQATAAFSNQWC